MLKKLLDGAAEHERIQRLPDSEAAVREDVAQAQERFDDAQDVLTRSAKAQGRGRALARRAAPARGCGWRTCHSRHTRSTIA